MFFVIIVAMYVCDYVASYLAMYLLLYGLPITINISKSNFADETNDLYIADYHCIKGTNWK